MKQARLARLLAAALACIPLGPSLAAGAAQLAEPRPLPARSEAAFRTFVETLRDRALAAGISPATCEAALRDLTGPDPRIVAQAQRQSEFSTPIGVYVAGAASRDRVAKGRVLAAQWAPNLAEIERRSGVPSEIVLAVWGLESGYGTQSGTFPVLRTLATLAFIGPRRELFSDEFVAALRILQSESIGRAELLGSWAGAMGQTQFMPSTFLADAIDGDRDGRRDIWRSTPDALASIANLLARHGWTRGQPAAAEVLLPGDLDLTRYRDSFAGWTARRVARADGAALPGSGDASLFLPAGIAGPAFLLGVNFEALRAYNTSDSYALGVSRLADAIAGAGPLARAWPGGATLDGPERLEVQRRLVQRGLYEGVPDGRFGAKTRDAVRLFQTRTGLVADGFADRAVLDALRQAP